MPYFMTQASFTEESLKAMVKKPSNRPDAMAKVVEAHGGRMRDFFWLFGNHDVVTIYEAPKQSSGRSHFLGVDISGCCQIA